MSEPEVLARDGQEEEDGGAAAAAAAVDGVGVRLRAAREALAMDAAAIADALKLSARQVEALEAGDWEKLPGRTFIRGFVRNYARVVKLDAEPLLADLDVPVVGAPRLEPPCNVSAVMPETGRAQTRDYAAVLVGVVVLAIAIVAYFVVPRDLWLATPPAAVVAAPPAETSGATTVAAVGKAEPLFPPGTVLTGDSSAPAAMPAEPGAAPAPGVAAEGVAAAADAGLYLSFAQPSWVEIRDRSGQLVLSQLNPANSERVVEGEAPFSLIVGNAAHVTVRYKGRPVELQPRSKDDVARVTVE